MTQLTNELLFVFIALAFVAVSVALAANFAVEAWANLQIARAELKELDKFLNDETDDSTP